MRIKFSLRRAGIDPVDLTATVDGTATVGDLAAKLAVADPTGRAMTAASGARLTIRVEGRQMLDPDLKVGDSGLRSGASAELVSVGRVGVPATSGPEVLVRVTSGPDNGREFELRRGVAQIGRDPECAIQLTDSLVSRKHARITVTDVVEVADNGSVNGTHVGESPITTVKVGTGDRVRVGDTELTIRIVRGGTALGAVDFVRAPRLSPLYQGVELDAPEPPKPPQAARFPIVPMIVPLLMAGVLWFITHSVLSLIFLALSPMMMAGYAMENSMAGKRDHRKALRVFRADLAEVVAEAEASALVESAARRSEHPSADECLAAVRTHGPLLWSRRPDDPGFLEFRVGLARLAARNSIVLPDRRGVPRDLMAELVTATEPFRLVSDVPILAVPGDLGAIGVAGSRHAALDVARGIVVQAVALHSPAELVCAGIVSAVTERDWDWLKWLPHTTSASRDLPSRLLTANSAETVQLLTELEELIAHREDTDMSSPAMLILVEDDSSAERGRLVNLAERGSAQGVHVLWVAESVARLPAACRTFVDVTRSDAAVGYVQTGDAVTPVVVDTMGAVEALEIARRLAPLIDSGALVDDDTDLPRSIPLMTIPEEPITAAPAQVVESWQNSTSILTGPHGPPEDKPVRHVGQLRAVIGSSATGPFAVDLRTDGPHALIGGTTGSGKSELLQSWILALALAHSPERLTFLLVDYKGGSAFQEFVSLPHNVGLVTDLTPPLVRRALVSLNAELKHRETLFHQHGVKDLVELERMDVRLAPPSLVIVVDEFAALVQERPEFIDGVVNVAQRGRSLGVHLILATQRPAGVIKGNLRANTNLRIALRTADSEDSTDVIGSTMAATFDQELRGRAVAKAGAGRLTTFQTGYVGGWTPQESPPPEILIEELCFGLGRQWSEPESGDPVPERGPTDIARLVGAIRTAAGLGQVRKPRRPWLNELQNVYDLSDPSVVPWTRSDDSLVFGIVDLPHQQRQDAVAFHPDRDGNLCVFGTGGSGKSTLLRTIAIAAGYSGRHGGPCQVYGLDFGSQALSMIECMPHVGAVIAGSDRERTTRLLSWLRAEVDERAVRYAKVAAGTIAEYRKQSGNVQEPRILLLIDGAAVFRKQYETADGQKWFDAVISIANEGRSVGVGVVFSADRANSMSTAMMAAVQTRVTLRMADSTDYALMSLPADVLGPDSPPGRGMLHGREIQVAILGQDNTVRAQTRAIELYAEAMRQARISQAPPVARLPERVSLAALPAQVAGMPVLGLSADTLEPQGFQPVGSFVVTGPAGSGRTQALRSLAFALRRWSADAQLYYFGASRRSILSTVDFWAGVAIGPEQVAEQARTLAEDVLKMPDEQQVALFIENIGALTANLATAAALGTVVTAFLDEDRFVVAESEMNTFGMNQGPIGALKEDRAGFALSPTVEMGMNVFRSTPFPRPPATPYPPGRGFLVRAGVPVLVQLALADDDPVHTHSTQK
jgi:S-DNA-T family DNA segregation ATPase FtsK/SpoIIIE